MKLLNSKTFENLAKAYAGECQARERYEFMEYGARNEGYKQVAELIDKVVYNEFNHARMFYTKMQDASDDPIKNVDIKAGYPFKQKWTLSENLKFAIEDEKNEIDLYSGFAATATKEGFDDIAELFKKVAEVENCHAMRFTDIYEQLKNKTIYKKEKPVKWKCADCGFEATQKEAWKTCPLCQAKQGSVMLVFEE